MMKIQIEAYFFLIFSIFQKLNIFKSRMNFWMYMEELYSNRAIVYAFSRPY